MDPGLRREDEKVDAGSQHTRAMSNSDNNCKRQERLLAERRHTFGEDHPETLTAMLDLADCWWAQGRLIAARKLEEQVVKGRSRLLGEEHADTLKATGKLAVTLAAQGNLGEARRLQEQVVTGRRSLFGDADPETLRAINNLAGTVASQGDFRSGTRAPRIGRRDGLSRVRGAAH
jgi:tetratricopeptide repeat protein